MYQTLLSCNFHFHILPCKDGNLFWACPSVWVCIYLYLQNYILSSLHHFIGQGICWPKIHLFSLNIMNDNGEGCGLSRRGLVQPQHWCRGWCHLHPASVCSQKPCPYKHEWSCCAINNHEKTGCHTHTHIAWLFGLGVEGKCVWEGISLLLPLYEWLSI